MKDIGSRGRISLRKERNFKNLEETLKTWRKERKVENLEGGYSTLRAKTGKMDEPVNRELNVTRY